MPKLIQTPRKGGESGKNAKIMKSFETKDQVRQQLQVDKSDKNK